MPGTYKAFGEIDMASAPALNTGLHDFIDGSDETFVVVDCSDVTFMDSAGYHALADATAYAARRGHTLMIGNVSPSCARLLRLCDQKRELHVDLDGDWRTLRLESAAFRSHDVNHVNASVGPERDDRIPA